MEKSLLVIDDDPSICNFICEAAELSDYSTDFVCSSDGLDLALDKKPSLIFLDLVMPDVDGVEVLRILNERSVVSDIVLCSGFDQRVLKSAEVLAREYGLSVIGSLMKPFRLDELQKLFSAQAHRAGSNLRNPLEISYFMLEEALANDEFQAFFQAKVDLQSRQVSGFEALLRWIHPEHGMISPADFIPFAEQSGQIRELSWLVVDQSLEMLKMLEDELPDASVSVNMPSELLIDIGFTDRLTNTIQAQGLSCDQVIVEVTESEAIEELASSLDVVTRLRMKGIGLSIDDFGTGHSNLERLAYVPFTELKLDKSFIDNLTDNSSNKIVKSSIDLAHELGMSVVAEGVEDESTLKLLQSYGCDQVQGYYFSRPMPSSHVMDWVRQFNSQEQAKASMT